MRFATLGFGDEKWEELDKREERAESIERLRSGKGEKEQGQTKERNDKEQMKKQSRWTSTNGCQRTRRAIAYCFWANDTFPFPHSQGSFTLSTSAATHSWAVLR
jgi:hypothetical protein